MTVVLAPIAGTVVPLVQVPDPVFAREMLGAGLAIEPSGNGVVAVLAPVAGTVAALHPHAVVLRGTDAAVLVHVGIDTVTLAGDGFTTRVARGDEVPAGRPLLDFRPGRIRERGLSALCVVVLMDAPPRSLATADGRTVAAGEPLFDTAVSKDP